MISIFFNVSFSLSVTSAQSAIVQVSTEDDFTLKSLQAQAQLYVEQIDTLSRQYDEAFRSTTVDMLLSQIEITRDKLNNTNQRIIDRLEELGRQGVVTKRAPITADSIFLAIPNAVRDKKIIQLICFGVLFIGLETSIIVAASKYRS
jgi:myo-inositol catabolism protein IolC